MRLNPGISIARADEVLRQASIKWSNARSAMNLKEAYHNVVRDTHPSLKQIIAAPSIAAGLHSSAYWNLLLAPNTPPAAMAVATEIENQVDALEHARAELEELKQLAARPGLPIVYDTNMLNHWRQPGDVLWREVLKAQGEDGAVVRLVIPLRVIDELDRQKYGQGDLARRAATAIRYLERVLKGSQPGEPVKVRRGATLEVWIDTDDRGGDADLSILRCAADLDNLHRDTGARVLTDDIGMRLRARQMGLKVLRLPEDHRKKGTAIDDVPPQDTPAAGQEV